MKKKRPEGVSVSLDEQLIKELSSNLFIPVIFCGLDVPLVHSLS